VGFGRVSIIAISIVLFAAPAWAQGSDLALKRVMLSLGGVGYFEFEAKVEGDASLPLTVGLDQVDDVLKSIVVFDDRGAVGQITLPGREPLSQAFKDLPFSLAALGSYEGLLNALSGAELTATGPRQLSGRILRVAPETVRLPGNGGETVKHRVTLVTAEGMRQFLLEDAETVRFADPALQKQVDEALAAIARHRQQDRRTLTVTAKGAGSRTLRVGYVVSAPLWKTSYRLTLPAGGGDAKGLLQGWAVVENLSGHDWIGIDLKLASGNPVTFRQQLYTAYFVTRPEVPVDVLARIAPPADSGGMAMSFARSGATAAAPPAAAQAPAFPGLRAKALEQADLITGEAMEGSTQVLFAAPGPVSVRSGETLMLPIANRAVPAERLALYQPGVLAANPMAALRITNDNGNGLPPGLITLYQQGSGGAAHIGDARFPLTPAGDKRLLSFAVDYKVAIDREERRRETISQVKISNGVLQLSTREEQTTLYRVRQPESDRHTLLIDHPRQPGWDLVTPKPDGVELAGNAYRITLGPTADATEVTLQRTQQNSWQVAAQSRQVLLGYARNEAFPPAVRHALEQAAAMQGEVARLDSQLRDSTAEAERIAKDQERLRQNLASVPQGSDLQKRYLEQMKVQEDRIDALRRIDGEARTKLASARDALADFISKLDL
jgi:hypothetical protein